MSPTNTQLMSTTDDRPAEPIEDGGGGGGGYYGGGGGGGYYGGGGGGGGYYGGGGGGGGGYYGGTGYYSGGGSYGGYGSGYGGSYGYGYDTGYTPVSDPEGYSSGGPTSASANGKTVTYTNDDGTTFTKTGDHPDRDSNPLDIGKGSFASGQGSIGSDGKFAIFSSDQAGFDAASNLMDNINGRTGNASGQTWTSGQATVNNLVTTWSPPSDGNNTAGMISSLSQAAGVTGDTTWSSMTADQKSTFINTYATLEGYHGHH